MIKGGTGFFFFVPFGIFDNETNWNNLLAWKPFKEQNWSLLISVLFWNLNGVDGCGNVCEEVKNGKLSIDDINEQTFENYLYTKGIEKLFYYFDYSLWNHYVKDHYAAEPRLLTYPNPP